MQIRQEMMKLSNQLNQNKERQDEMQQQAQAAMQTIKSNNTKEDGNSQAEYNLKLAKKKY